MILLKKCMVFAPISLGLLDILLGGGRILGVAPTIDPPRGVGVEMVDCSGLSAIPGLIDAHVHIAGAGGEGGPATRTPEMQLSHMIEAGGTTVIGCLGTDGFTRSFESVLMKVKSLRAQGVSAWMYAGAYQVSTPTLTGDVGRDLSLIDEVIGVGEIALSDHRSSHPSAGELTRLAAHTRVGGMLGGKAGIVNIHMGDAKNPFAPLYSVVENSELSFRQFIPTHINRNHYIFEDAKTYGKQGVVDITTSSWPYFPDEEIKPSEAVRLLLEAGVPLEHITMTSDAFGSLQPFDSEGNLIRLEMGLLTSLFNEMCGTELREQLDLSTTLGTVTSNPARVLKISSKGRIRTGADADICLIDSNLNLNSVIALGEWMLRDGQLLRKGTYEP